MIRINLAPGTGQQGTRTAALRLDAGFLLGALALFLAGGIGLRWWSLHAESAVLGREIDASQRELDRLQTLIDTHRAYRRDKEVLERRVHAIETIARHQTSPAFLLDAVAALVPPEVSLTRMEERAGRVRFAGATPGSASLADFMRNLETSDKFRDIDLVESRQDPATTPGTVTFEVSARFDG